MNALYVNCNTIDITPSESVVLTGYANRNGLSTSVHRSLSSRCAVLKVGGEIACLVADDLLDIMPQMTQEIIHRIAEETAIPASRIFIHAIHTHSAPGMEYGLSEANDRYIGWVTSRIVQNAAKTFLESSAYQTCSVRYGSAQCDISSNRRLIDPQTGVAAKVSNIQGANDREVAILQMVNSFGVPVVTLFNFACHPVILGYDSTVVSTDYPGAARETIEHALGGMAIFLNGAAGNINPCLTDQTDPAIVDQEGRKLGQAVVHSRLDVWNGSLDVHSANRTIQLPYRDQHMTAERFLREVERRLGEQTEFHNWQQDLRKWSAVMIDHLDKGTVPDTCSIAIGAIRIGPAVFLLSQGEVFIEYQIRAKQRCPGKKVIFAAYTNGMKGYIPTEEAFRHHGYEVDQAYVYMEEPSPLTPDADQIYMNAVNDLLREVV
jgi:Neutral/alkaline non-lysosomal ceramidase, N-terminal